MNLVQHLLVAERMRERLGWGAELRGQMLLGALAPDAHSLRPGMGRAALHPEPGEDHAEFVVRAIAPPGSLGDAGGRAFAASCVGHLVADGLLRGRACHLPPHAPSGFAEVPSCTTDTPGACFDAEAIARSLMRAPVVHWLEPLTPAMMDGKRWETLGRFPLKDATGIYVAVEPLATMAQYAADQALARMYDSEAGRLLVGEP